MKASSTAMTASLVLLVLLAAAASVQGMILGIDVGSEFIKAALVKPGTGFEIVTNTNSKRKTEAMVSFYEDQRLFAGDANALITRKPQVVVHRAVTMLGRTSAHPAVQTLNDDYLAYGVSVVEDRNTLKVKVGTSADRGKTFIPRDEFYAQDTPEYTIEELVAMELTYIRHSASDLAGAPVKDCVITVPVFATQAEREAILDAAALAGLNVLSLVEANTAAAIQYGIDRVFENTTHHTLIYNMGAESTQVSVFASTAYKKFGKTIGQAKMVGKAWDVTLGGRAFAARLREHLADQFNAEFGPSGTPDIRTSPRAMAKLSKKANKVKEILSANEEIVVFEESLFDGKDFRTKVSRETLASLCTDLFERAKAPVEKALADAKLSHADIDEIEIIGGGIRVPQLQTNLKAQFEERLPLGVHLNGDESMAFGSAFLGANRSVAFRVRKSGMIDTAAFAIGVRLAELSDAAEPVDADAKPWSKRSQLFRRYNHLQSIKKITFPHDRDFAVRLQYEQDPLLPEGTGNLLAAYHITGLAEAAANRTDLGKPKVHLSFKLDNNGIARLTRAEATQEEIIVIEEPKEEPIVIKTDRAEKAAAAGEEEDDGTGEGAGQGEGAADSDAGARRASEAEADEEQKEEEPEAGEAEKKEEAAAEAEAKKEAGDADAEKEEAKPEPKTKKIVHRYPLTITVDTSELLIKPMSQEHIDASAAVLKALNKADQDRRDREAAKNTLESFVYATRDQLEDSEEFVACSTEEVREKLAEEVESTQDWLYDEGEDASTKEYRDRLRTLTELVDPITFRMEQLHERPAAVERAHKGIEATRDLIASWAEKKPWLNETRVEAAAAAVQTFEDWLTEKEAEQAELPAYETPVLTPAGIEQESASFISLVRRLDRMPKPKPKPVEEEADKAAADTDAAADADADAEAAAEGEGDAEAEPAADAAAEGAADAEAEGTADAQPAAEAAVDADGDAEAASEL